MVLVVRPVPLPGIVGVRRCKGAIPRSRTEAESKSDPRGVFVISGGFVTFCEIVRNDPDENSMLLIVLGCPVGKTTRHQGGGRRSEARLSRAFRLSQWHAAGAEASSQSGRDTSRTVKKWLRVPFVLEEDHVENSDCKYIPT